MAETGMWAYIYFGHEIWFIHVYVAQLFFFFGGGTPQIPRLCVYPDRRADIWSPHEPQAPMSNMEQKTSNFLSGLLQMCARSPHISVLEPYIIYHTLCLVLHPSILVWLPNISPVPTRPPTLRSLYHPLTWLHTNEILHTGSIISGFCWGFFFFLHPHGMSEELPCPLFLRQAQFILMMQQIQSRKIKQQFQWPQLLVLDDRDALDFVFVCLYRAFCLL